MTNDEKKSLLTNITQDAGNIGAKLFKNKTFMSNPKLLLLVANIFSILIIAKSFSPVGFYDSTLTILALAVIALEFIEYQGRKKSKTEVKTSIVYKDVKTGEEVK